MERRLMSDLMVWRDAPGRKPLILRGVRQCGKTWLLQEFGRIAFDDVAYVNFERDPSFSVAFDQGLSPERIITDLGVRRGKAIVPGQSLVIFDEIQACPQALTALKYFAEEMPGMHICAAGSLLGVALAQAPSFPVGKVDFLFLHPLTFDEFLAANGENLMIDHLQGLGPGDVISQIIADRCEELYREYIFVGGMPEAVSAWVGTRDVSSVETIQQAILDSYELDMAKHAKAPIFPKIQAIWRSIPRQLARENKKFIFSHVREGWRAKDLEDALEWLIGAGLVVKVPRAKRPGIPLASFADDAFFKIYLCDIGLLRRLAGVPAAMVNAGVDPVLGSTLSADYSLFRGAMTENYVANHLVASMGAAPYFWRSGNTAEVDFIVSIGTDIIPIEVKSEKNTASKSLAVYRSTYSPRFSIKTTLKPTLNGNLPLWLLWNLAVYVGKIY